jgi:hypothetical protein
MVWLNRSPLPVGRRCGNFLGQMISTCLPSRRGRGAWVGTLWSSHSKLISDQACLHGRCAILVETTEYIFSNRVSVSAHSAGAYTATLLVMVQYSICNEKGVGGLPPPTPAWANFTLMMECLPESSRCFSVYSVVEKVTENIGCMLAGEFLYRQF